MPDRFEGPLTSAKIRKTQNEADFILLRSAILRSDYLHRRTLETALMNVTLGIRQIIESSKLAPEEKNEIYQNLSQVPISIAQAQRDARKSLGDETPKNGGSN